MPGLRFDAAPAGSLQIWILVSRFCVDVVGAFLPLCETRFCDQATKGWKMPGFFGATVESHALPL
jgi:hypothetical protein